MLRSLLSSAFVASCLVVALGTAYFYSTPQVLQGAAALVLGGNTGCNSGAGSCGVGAKCSAIASTTCYFTTANSDYCCDTAGGGVCAGCSNYDHYCTFFYWNC
jgi:hypothetical protein